MPDIYKYALPKLSHFENLRGTTDLEGYLESLRPHMISLWHGYRSNNINIDYSIKEIQYCYVLRYLNLYYNHSKFLIRKLQDLNIKNTLNCAFFGSGPSAEVVSLLELVSENVSHNFDNLTNFNEDYNVYTSDDNMADIL